MPEDTRLDRASMPVPSLHAGFGHAAVGGRPLLGHFSEVTDQADDVGWWG
jgi:hypothetical protein